MEKKVPAVQIHAEIAAMLSRLDNNKAGLIIKAMCEYQFNGDPDWLKDQSLRLAFDLIRERMDRDRAAYADKCARNSANAALRWQVPAQEMRTDANAYDRMRTDANDAKLNLNLNIKPKEKDKKKILFIIPEKLSSFEFLQAWDDWQVYRKERKNSLTQSTATKQLAMLAEYPPDVAARIINRSIEHGWIGLFAPNAADKPVVDKSITGLMSIKVK